MIEENLQHITLRNNIVLKAASQGNQVIIPELSIVGETIVRGGTLRFLARDRYRIHKTSPLILKGGVVVTLLRGISFSKERVLL